MGRMPYLLPVLFTKLSLSVASGFRLFKNTNRFTGAAFLMATAAIGPGFITQTTVFTGQLFTSFGFVILISILLDIIVQLNIWRAITVSGKRAPEVANNVLPGLGTLLVVLVAAGGFIFNIGNIGGSSLALQSLFGLSLPAGALLSCALAVVIFLVKEFGKAMDAFTKLLGMFMIGLMLYVAWTAHPPVAEMVVRSIIPEKIDVIAIVTLVGGTVGGYISFAGAHRMLDAGVKGMEQLPDVNKGAVTGIMLAGIMRILLFAAVAGVVATGFSLPAENPAAAVFGQAAGNIGLKMFGIILWAAAITSVVAAAYTSVSFMASESTWVAARQRYIIIVFIILSAVVFSILGNPTKLLVRAGTINGLVLPIALAAMLLAVTGKEFVAGYKHPGWLLIAGWLVVLLLTVMSIRSIYLLLGNV
jgi:Mn2+/Fe2+ NRAMP family transporter